MNLQTLNPIRPLPEDVVYLIAASEVIDSPAAVVRELVENAIDAGATRITISLTLSSWRIQVADNGLGMDLTNLKQAATPHSTSKICTVTDLWQINSLGFRGEALHSLAQLADLEICSRSNLPGVQDGGWRVIYNHQGEPIRVEEIAIAPGTIVTVSNLFGNWIVRRDALPSPNQLLRDVQQILYHVALCYPQVTWQIYQNESLWWQISPGMTPQTILPQLVKTVRFSDLQFLKIKLESDTNLREYFQGLELLLGLPDRCHRRRPDWIKVAVNGRMVRSPELEQTILNALARTCPRDRYPICFIHLHLTPDQIDWNRHPAKEEIYLHHLNDWQEQIRQGIDQALGLNAEIMTAKPHRVESLLRASESSGKYQTRRSLPSETEQELKADPDGLGLIELKAIAQVHNTYIVAEHSSGLWLIEQHIAHERVLYDQICENWKLVPLEPAIILQQLSDAQLEQLHRLGLEIDAFGEGLWAVRTAPELLAKRDDCAAALIELSLGGDLQAAQAATACRSAIRNGTPLSLSEMQTLLEQWVKTRNPRTCPHGRPICLQLEETSLARFFRRHWVIGKSHGI